MILSAGRHECLLLREQVKFLVKPAPDIPSDPVMPEVPSLFHGFSFLSRRRGGSRWGPGSGADRTCSGACPAISVDVLGLEDLERSIVELHAHRRRDEARVMSTAKNAVMRLALLMMKSAYVPPKNTSSFRGLGPAPAQLRQRPPLCPGTLSSPISGRLALGGVQVPLVDDDLF